MSGVMGRPSVCQPQKARRIQLRLFSMISRILPRHQRRCRMGFRWSAASRATMSRIHSLWYRGRALAIPGGPIRRPAGACARSESGCTGARGGGGDALGGFCSETFASTRFISSWLALSSSTALEFVAHYLLLAGLELFDVSLHIREIARHRLQLCVLSGSAA